MRLGHSHLIIFVAGFILTVTAMEMLTNNTPSNHKIEELDWNELAKKSISSASHKKRNLAPSITNSRKPSSETPELILNNGKGRFILQGQIVNIEKNAGRPPRNRLVATKLESGKQGYLSGEIILGTADKIKNQLPLTYEGVEIKLMRQLPGNKYLLLVTPATEVPKALEHIRAIFTINSLKVDIVDREIKAL